MQQFFNLASSQLPDRSGDGAGSGNDLSALLPFQMEADTHMIYAHDAERLHIFRDKGRLPDFPEHHCVKFNDAEALSVLYAIKLNQAQRGEDDTSVSFGELEERIRQARERERDTKETPR